MEVNLNEKIKKFFLQFNNFFLKYAAGGEVYAKLRSAKKFSEENSATVIRQVTLALYALHR